MSMTKQMFTERLKDLLDFDFPEEKQAEAIDLVVEYLRENRTGEAADYFILIMYAQRARARQLAMLATNAYEAVKLANAQAGRIPGAGAAMANAVANLEPVVRGLQKLVDN